VSIFTHPHRPIFRIWQAARQGRYRLLVSPAIITEVAEVLRTIFAWEEARIVRRLKALVRVGDMMIPHITLEVIREDLSDNRILECAVEGQANLIVSGDRHLRRLRTYQGISIVRSIDFMWTLGLIDAHGGPAER
jgi:hypothetical protein